MPKLSVWSHGLAPFALVAACATPAQTPVPRPPAVYAPTLVPAQAQAARAPITLSFVGDVMFGRYREHGFAPIERNGHDVFAKVRDLIAADVAVFNLETPLVDRLDTRPRRYPVRRKFGADPRIAGNLSKSGFTHAQLANNHMVDLGRRGLGQTPAVARELGIVPLGSATPTAPALRVETIEKGGWRIGALVVTATRNWNENFRSKFHLPYVRHRHLAKTLAPLVRAARDDHDIVMVLVHSGKEYVAEREPAEVRVMRALIDAGADLVIGSHPHVLQAIERYRHGIIAHSLGNFVFESVRAPLRWGGVLRVTFDERGCMSEVRFKPTVNVKRPFPHPVPARRRDARRAHRRIARRGFAADGVDWVATTLPACRASSRTLGTR